MRGDFNPVYLGRNDSRLLGFPSLNVGFSQWAVATQEMGRDECNSDPWCVVMRILEVCGFNLKHDEAAGGFKKILKTTNRILILWDKDSFALKKLFFVKHPTPPLNEATLGNQVRYFCPRVKFSFA